MRIKPLLRDYWMILIAPLLLLGPTLARGQVLFWGTPALQFVPWWSYAFDSLRQGALPLWNPLNGLGAPLLANYQLAFFYPPNWLLLVAAALSRPGDQAVGIAWGFTWLAVFHLAWAGLGMALLLRQMRFGWLAQTVGGLAFGLTGYVVARLGFFSMVWVAAWLPWVILFTDQLVSWAGSAEQAGRARLCLLPGLIISLAMQLLAGHAQLTWYTLLLAGVWGTVRAFGGGWRRVLVVWLSFGASALIAVGLAAVQLVPTFEYLSLSQRAGAFAYEDAMTYSFWPWRLLTLFAPDFFGSPAGGDYWGYASYWEDHLYAGMLPLLLALATLWVLVKGIRKSRRSRWWGLIGLAWIGLLLTFVLAMGRSTPVFPFLYRYVPTFDMFQAPARYLIWAAFLLPLLAAVGIEHWRYPSGRGLYWFRLGTAGAFAVTLGAGLAYLLMQDIRLTFVRAAALAGMWALGFGLLTLSIQLARQHNRVGLWQWAVIAWTLADLLVTGWSLNPGAPADFFRSSPAAERTVPGLDAGQRVYLGRLEEYDLKFKRFLRFKDFSPLEDWGLLRAVLMPNTNLLDGVSSANNFDPLLPGRYTRWFAHLETLSPAEQQVWLARAGVGAVEHIDISQETGVRFDPVPGASRFWWYPCARFVTDGDEAWQNVEAQMESGPGELIVEGAPPADLPSCGSSGAGQPIEVEVTAERANRLALSISAPSAGWLTTADSWYPGWQVSVDDAPVKLYPANSLFRAVYVPQGSHKITFDYRPTGFYFGALFSILVLLCTVLGFTIWGRRSKERRPS